MTYEYDSETNTRRGASRGAKVLIFGFAIFATLGAFWTVVWFIRSYVEQPRIALRPPMTLASRESEPAPAPRDPAATPSAPAQVTAPAQQRPPLDAPPPEKPVAAAAPTVPPPPAQASGPASPLSDRWFPTAAPAAPWPDSPGGAGSPANAMAPATPVADPAQPAADQESEPAEDVVVASMQPAITGPVPRPRAKPPTNSASAKLREPPLPRPRPDASAQQQSVWTAVPPTDDRFPQPSQ